MCCVKWLFSGLDTGRPPGSSFELGCSQGKCSVVQKDVAGMLGCEFVLRPKELLCHQVLCVLSDGWLPWQYGDIGVYAECLKSFAMLLLFSSKEVLLGGDDSGLC